MTGPAAPKDPSEKRPGFYVLLDKQVGGIPQDDGRGVHSIFISSDRLPSAARVTGGVEDEAVLKLLTDVAGFRKLVHSLGVSISAPNPALEVGFSLICKGNGGPGSCHRFTFPADGAERVITLDGSVQPDLVVEFAVNDAGDETEGVFYESLVRHILEGPGHPAVILLFAVFADDWNLKRRLAPIGYRHQLPMVDVLEAVSPQFGDPENRVITKRQYFYDVYHPSNLGHKIMADCLLYCLDRLAHQQPEEEREEYIPPYYGADFENLRLMDRKDPFPGAVVSPGSFTETDTDLQAVPLDDDDHNTPMFPHNWKKGTGNEPFVLELECRRLVLEFKDSGSQEFGKALVTIDGEKRRILDPTEAGWTHCHATVLFNKQSTARHRIEISMAPGDEGKTFTILGFGVVR